MFLKLLIISFVFILAAFAGLGIRILIKSHSSFPETHISRNPEMQKRGISCAQHNDVGCNPTDENTGCCSCSLKQV